MELVPLEGVYSVYEGVRSICSDLCMYDIKV